MKTKELVYELDKMGFLVVETNGRVEVRKASRINEEGNLLAYVDKLNYALMDVSTNLSLVEPYVRAEILRVLYKYATTPLYDREPTKKYVYEFIPAITGVIDECHICRDHINQTDHLILDTSGEEHALASDIFQFTDEQVEQYTGKDRQLFELCEKIEVIE